MQQNIVLVGLMGAGKSTIGKQLARRLKLEFIDTDRYLEERTGVSIPTIFAIEGEEGFREREAEIIQELSQRSNVILATGGGSILREVNRQILRSCGKVVYLRATPEQLYERIRHDRSRPLMQTNDPLQKLRDLLAFREPLYQDAAHIVVQSGRQRVSTILREICQQLATLSQPVELTKHKELSNANATR